MNKMTDEELLAGIDQMIEQAPEVGLCTFGFKILRDGVAELASERDQLKTFRDPQSVKPYTGHLVDGVGECPRCKSVFLDRSTPYCGNCGQALDWGV